jgi:4'-phosphopantetheinyl transferase
VSSVIRVWVSRPSQVEDRSGEHALLSQTEIERMRRYVHRADRDRFSTAWSLARRTLGELLGKDPRLLRFDRQCTHCGDRRHGKPRLLDARVEFSIAHASDRVLLAVSTQAPVGVDVEPIEARVEDLATSLLHPAEVGTDRSELLRLWVRKEAVLKATGHGLARPMTGFSTLTAPVGMVVEDLPCGDDYVAAVAAISKVHLPVELVPD